MLGRTKTRRANSRIETTRPPYKSNILLLPITYIADNGGDARLIHCRVINFGVAYSRSFKSNDITEGCPENWTEDKTSRYTITKPPAIISHKNVE
jgi:hypothetical protein